MMIPRLGVIVDRFGSQSLRVALFCFRLDNVLYQPAIAEDNLSAPRRSAQDGACQGKHCDGTLSWVQTWFVLFSTFSLVGIMQVSLN